ncbi:MAG: AAA-like domain-containing protein [Plectolyngbya sp. WJT66-NPBG17]|jgi:serine/threonine-protein kinase|nr:AAA-like domain-containing protein [Plectolyngbya sp. WJT66-NPBG17]
MGRSLRVHADAIAKVKAGLRRNGYARQKDLAEELGIALSTLSNYLNGRPVDYVNFTEISGCLGLDWQAISAELTPEETVDLPTSGELTSNLEPTLTEPDTLPEAFIYVERPPIERICYEALLHPSTLLRIKAPRLMGKTSLVLYLLRQTEKQGYRTIHLNFHLANQADFQGLSTFLQWFCASVTQQLQLSNRLA